MFKIISINETQFFCNGCGEVFVWEFNTHDKKPPKDWDGRYDTASLCSINVPDYRGVPGLYPSGFDACSAFNQDVPIDDRIMKLEGEILRVTHFCFDPRIREAFKEMGYERIAEVYESRGIDIEDTGMLEKVKSVFCTYVFLLNQQDKTLGIDLSVVPSVGSYSIRFNECIQDSIVFKDETTARAFAKANGLEKPFISFYKMTACWQPFEEGDAV